MRHRTFCYLAARSVLGLRDALLSSMPLPIRLEGGEWYWFFSHDNVGKTLFLERTGVEFVRPFELRERKFVRAFLKSGDTFFDIGANSGVYTLIASRAVGPAGMVYAFEPAPSEFRKLSRNVRWNRLQNVRIFPTAVGEDNQSQVPFWVLSHEQATLSSFARGENNSAVPIKVSQVSLDSFVAREKITKIKLIKIDVEGAELLILRGGRTLFRWSGLRPAILCELSDKRTSRFGYGAREILDFLKKEDYLWYILDERGKPTPAPTKVSFNYENWVALPKESETALLSRLK